MIRELATNIAKKTGQGLDMISTGIDRGLGLPGRVLTGFNPAVPKEFSNQVGEAVSQTTGNRTLGAGASFVASMASPDIAGKAKKARKVAMMTEEALMSHLMKQSIEKTKENILDMVHGISAGDFPIRSGKQLDLDTFGELTRLQELADKRMLNDSELIRAVGHLRKAGYEPIDYLDPDRMKKLKVKSKE